MVEGTGVGRRDPSLDPTARLDIDPAGEDPAEIRQDIEQTRAAMTETIDAIEAKLSPDNLKAEAKDAIRDATLGKAEEVVNNVQESAKGVVNDVTDTVSSTGTSFLETIKANPIPAALTAVGIGWLVMSSRKEQSTQRGTGGWSGQGQFQGRSGAAGNFPVGNYQTGTWHGASYAPSTGPRFGTGGYGTTGSAYGASQGSYTYGTGYGYGQSGTSSGTGAEGQGQGVMGQAQQMAGQVTDQAGQVAGQVTDQAGQVVDQAQQMAGQFADQAQQQFAQFADQAQMQAQQFQSQFHRWMREAPLAVGAAALGLGLAVGLAVPETEQEAQFLAPARDRVIDRAGDYATQAADKVEQAVHEAAGSMSPNQGQQGTKSQRGSSQPSAQAATSGTEKSPTQSGSATGAEETSTSAQSR